MWTGKLIVLCWSEDLPIRRIAKTKYASEPYNSGLPPMDGYWYAPIQRNYYKQAERLFRFPMLEICIIYTPMPCEVSFSLSNPPLRRSELTHNTEIRVEPISSDSYLRDELRGWYKIIGEYAENQNENRFSFSSYEAKWIAFSHLQTGNRK